MIRHITANEVFKRINVGAGGIWGVPQKWQILQHLRR